MWSDIFQENKYQVLFARYFNPSMVYNLIGYFHRINFKNYEITILSDDQSSLDVIQDTIKLCTDALSIAMIDNIKYPVEINNRKCSVQPGCDSVSTKDIVQVDGENYTVNMYDFNV